jgi:hypothetical protein
VVAPACDVVPHCGRRECGKARARKPVATPDPRSSGTGQAQQRQRSPVVTVHALGFHLGPGAVRAQALGRPLGRLPLARGCGRPVDCGQLGQLGAEALLRRSRDLRGRGGGHRLIA